MGKQSVVLFSMHRSASTFMIDFLKRLASLSSMRHVWIDPKLESMPHNKGKHVRIIPPKIQKNFSPVGRIYGPHRRFANIPDLQQYKTVMVLRDPRDVLVSLFFAQVYSHGPPPDKQLRIEYLRRSRKAKEQGIDQYVLAGSDNILAIYRAYLKAHKENEILLLTYEEMVTNFPVFLKKLLGHCDLAEHYKTMLKFNKFKPPKENIYAHKRQMTPGDFARKLKGPTIKRLNEKFRGILDWLGGKHEI